MSLTERRRKPQGQAKRASSRASENFLTVKNLPNNTTQHNNTHRRERHNTIQRRLSLLSVLVVGLVLERIDKVVKMKNEVGDWT